jgi:DNA-directed RNA polymerase subunit beta
MTHSQYLLPALPDLLKSHRLSYKKFLHNGIDEEFDLLSAKTELNEEELFYEGLKLSYVDELSPSQVESLDYIYHPEEKIFLIPKRTLEDSLRGRQSHSFHLFVPLEVKILPFQDELDPTHSILEPHFETIKSHETQFPTSLHSDLDQTPEQKSSIASNFRTKAPVSPTLTHKSQKAKKQKSSGRNKVSSPVVSPFKSFDSSPHVFFRGGSGQPLSEKRKEFYKTALQFFFQQPKIQEIGLTKRFLLLRWFCEKLQHLDPEMGKPSEDSLQFKSLSAEHNLAFHQFNDETKTKLFQIYQTILGKFENRTQKNALRFENRKSIKQPAGLKVFQKTGRWGGLFGELQFLLQEKRVLETQNMSRAEMKPDSIYPSFPDIPSFPRYQSNLSESEKKTTSKVRSQRSREHKTTGNNLTFSSLRKSAGSERGLLPIQALSKKEKKSSSRLLPTGPTGRAELGPTVMLTPKRAENSRPTALRSKRNEPIGPKVKLTTVKKSSAVSSFSKPTRDLAGNQQTKRKPTKGVLLVQKVQSAASFDFDEFDSESKLFENSELFLEDDSNFDEFRPNNFNSRNAKKAEKTKDLKIDNSAELANVELTGQASFDFPYDSPELVTGATFDDPFLASDQRPTSKTHKVSILSSRQLRSGKFPKTPKGFAGKRSKPYKKDSSQKRQPMGPTARAKLGPKVMLAQVGSKTIAGSGVTVGKGRLDKNSKVNSTGAKNGTTELSLDTFPNSPNFEKSFKLFKFVNLPGFNLKKSGLTAGRTLQRRVRSPHDQRFSGLSTPEKNKAFFRFGQIETTKWAPKKLAFLRRIVQAITLRNKKKKLTEIFFTTFPPLSEKRGLRFWRLSGQQNQTFASQNMSPHGTFRETHRPKGNPAQRVLPRFFTHFKKFNPLEPVFEQSRRSSSNMTSGQSEAWTSGKLIFLESELRVPQGPSKFLSLPQKELGSLWKVNPRFKGQGLFQRYQLQKLAYRQRNMFIAERPGILKKKTLTSSKLHSEKNIELNRFIVKVKDRRVLHSKKNFQVRERAAYKIEKKSHLFRLLPGLEFWQKAHSDKKVEEYWESILQRRRQKLPSKVLVSVPTGDVIFLKSEKESQPKALNLGLEGSENPEEDFEPTSWDEPVSSSSRNSVSEHSGSKLSLGLPLRRAKAPKRLGSPSWGHVWKRSGSPHDNRSFRSKNETLWVFELANMKLFTKEMVNYSPATLNFCWKYRFSFLWNALSDQITQSSDPDLLVFRERENLPKVCSDLRKLLSPLYELLFREIHEPKKFFVSGQVGKKEWPIQKDGSKSYFALLNLGKMPFMTKQGNFLINGSARVLVSQIAKCPNFYTKMKIDSRGRPRYWTEFVSSFKNAGEWIQFHIDLENKMFFSLGTKRKYSIFIFLGALGISPSEIPDVIEHWDFLKQSIHKEEILSDKNQNFLTYLVEPLEVREARVLFHDTQNYSFYPGWEKTDEELQKFFEDMFYNPARYFLGYAGREALNQRRRFSGMPSRSRALEKEDFLAAINGLIEVRLGLAPPDDIDHLKYRRVRLPGELLQNEFHLALEEIFTLDLNKFREGPLPGDALDQPAKDQRRTIFPSLQDLEQKIFEKGRPFSVSKTVGIQSTYQVTPLEKRMRNFFHTGQLSQYMDQTNPLAEITHKRRLTSLGPDGLPKQVGVAVRELHPSHFGRICPIETPEGLNAGLVASLSSQAQIGSNHTLLAPYYWVKDGTREFPQKIFNNDIPQSADLTLEGFTALGRSQNTNADNEIGRLMSFPISSSGNEIQPQAAHEVGSFDLTKDHVGSHLLENSTLDLLNQQNPHDPSQLDQKSSSLLSSGFPFGLLVSRKVPCGRKYPPVLPEIIFLSASAEDSVYICSEDYWFSSKYKNFETVQMDRGSPELSGLLPTGPTGRAELGPTGRAELGPTGRAELRLASTLSEKDWSKVDSKNSLVKFQTVFPARYQQEFFTVTKSQIDFFGICPTQMISVGTSLIPFLEHDDANRALMGSNMQRQALPLLVLERPIVGTGSEKGVAQSSNAVLLSEFSGQVSFVDGRKIVVDSFPKTITSFTETFKAKNSRLLLGSFEKNSGRAERKAKPTGPSVKLVSMLEFEDSSTHELEDVFPSGRRSLFGKFQNRTEDGKVKTIRRIFTVKIKIQGNPQDCRSSEMRAKSRSGKADGFSAMSTQGARTKVRSTAAHTTARNLTAGQIASGPVGSRVIVKVFPISEEEYEKSRNLLRREFIQKYKEIQKKKVFPADFWPGERWKKTGEIWEEVFANSCRPPSGVLPMTGAQTPLESLFLKKKRKTSQHGTFAPELLSSDPLFFTSKGVKRIRYKKPNLTLDTVDRFRPRKEPTKPSVQASLRPQVVTEKSWASSKDEKIPLSLTTLLKKKRTKSDLVRSYSVKRNSGFSHKILKKKSLRSSILPLKGGRLFFEPTPQMIFKNILSKNSKKREILRKALIYQSFMKTQSTATNEIGHVLTNVLSAAENEKISWSVSMKKVTPYTQVTYNVQRYWRTNQNTLRRQRPSVLAGDWVAAGDLLADSSATLRGELCVGQNILVGYVPWEGYNFEDAIVVNERLVEEDIYTSILIDRYEMEASIDAGEKITRKIPDIKPHLLKNLDSRGIICVGTWVEEDDILVGKILPVTTELQGYSKLLADIYQIAPPVAKDVSFRVPDRVSGRILESSVSERIVRTADNKSFSTPWKVTLYLVEKRRMKLGDKMSGRHGNKGIVSIILPPQDMPFLPDGTPLDVALNPLGVPSRMNVGQLLESLLGLAGHHLHQKYRIPAFDEMYGEDFSRRIVYDKLLEASQKTQKPWLFNPNFPGKMMLRDGRTGEYFHQPVLVGYPYMLKLIHMVDDKMHARATGPYTMVTQQPLKGRANRGGQRIGEMEVWAVEAFAASYALQELLTLKSDDITGRNHFLMNFLKRKKRTVGGIPDAFRVLMHELQSLCFHVHYTEDYRLTYPTLLESSKIPETPIPGTYGRGS